MTKGKHSQPKYRFQRFVNFKVMEKDEANLLAAKALRARLLGNRKEALRWENELEDLRKGKTPEIQKGFHCCYEFIP